MSRIYHIDGGTNSKEAFAALLLEALGEKAGRLRGRGLDLAVMALSWHSPRHHKQVLAAIRRVALDTEEQDAIQVIYHMGGLQGEKAVRRYLWWRIISEGKQHA